MDSAPHDEAGLPFADGLTGRDLPVTPVPTRPERDEMTIVFGGDTCLGHSYLSQARWPEPRERLLNDPHSFFAGLAPLVAERDALVLNLETVLADEPADIFDGRKSYLGWDNPERTLSVLRDQGVSAVTVANNHFMDFGGNCATATLRHLAEAGIATAGAGRTLRDAAIPLRLGRVLVFPAFEKRRIYAEDYGFYAGSDRTGVLGFDRTAQGIADLIGAYRAAYPDDLVIFTPHWGGSRNYGWATPKMQEQAEWLIAAGADLVMGHGAHALQEIDFRAAGAVVYSIGNFVFNSPGRYAAMGGFPYSFVARLTVAGRKARLRLYPFHCDNRVTGFHNRPVTEDEGAMVRDVLRARSGSPPDFDATVGLGRDRHGVYLAHLRPLSPRFGLL